MTVVLYSTKLKADVQTKLSVREKGMLMFLMRSIVNKSPIKQRNVATGSKHDSFIPHPELWHVHCGPTYKTKPSGKMTSDNVLHYANDDFFEIKFVLITSHPVGKNVPYGYNAWDYVDSL